MENHPLTTIFFGDGDRNPHSWSILMSYGAMGYLQVCSSRSEKKSEGRPISYFLRKFIAIHSSYETDRTEIYKHLSSIGWNL